MSHLDDIRVALAEIEPTVAGLQSAIDLLQITVVDLRNIIAAGLTAHGADLALSEIEQRLAAMREQLGAPSG